METSGLLLGRGGLHVSYELVDSGETFGAVVAFDHWINSLAKTSELAALADRIHKVEDMTEKTNEALESIGKQLDDLKKPKKWGQ